jgi:hypothetical protein
VEGAVVEGDVVEVSLDEDGVLVEDDGVLVDDDGVPVDMLLLLVEGVFAGGLSVAGLVAFGVLVSVGLVD